MADTNLLTEFFNAPDVDPPPAPAGPDVDLLSDFFSHGEPSKRLQLGQELEQARRQQSGADTNLAVAGAAEVPAKWAADPLGTLFTGLHTAGRATAGLVADTGLEAGRFLGLTDQPSNFENLREALFGNDESKPLPMQEQLAQQPGVGAALTSGILGTAATAPTLAAGAVLTAATGGAAAPFVVYPALFGGEALHTTGDVGHAIKSAAVGAFYPAVGKLVGPVAANIINRLGAVNKPVAQKAIETVVDQALMQSATHLISVPEYATMTPEERERAFFENTGSILVFTVPRVLGHASGKPSEYESVIHEEMSKMRDYMRGEREKELTTAMDSAAVKPEQRQSRQVGAAIRAGLIPVGRARTPQERQRRLAAEKAGDLATTDLIYQSAVEEGPAVEQARIDSLTVGGSRGRRTAARVAEEESRGTTSTELTNKSFKDHADRVAATIPLTQRRNRLVIHELDKHAAGTNGRARVEAEIAEIDRQIREILNPPKAAAAELPVEPSPGLQAILRIEAMPPAEASKLNHKPEWYEGIAFTPEDVPALIAARDVAHKRFLEATEAANKNQTDPVAQLEYTAAYGRHLWLTGAIEWANRKGPNYEAAEAAKAAKPPVAETPEALIARLEAEAAALEVTAPTRRAERKAAAAAAEPWAAELEAAKARAVELNKEWSRLNREGKAWTGIGETFKESPEARANINAREANKNEWGGADPLTITPKRAAEEWKKRTEAKPPKQAAEPKKPAPGKTASVPVMITRQMEADLLARGMTQEQINKLTPIEANAILTAPAGKAVELMTQEEYAQFLAQNPGASKTRGQGGFYNELITKPELRGKKLPAISPEDQKEIYSVRIPAIAKVFGVDKNEPWISLDIGDANTKNPDGSRSKLYITINDWKADWTPEQISKFVEELKATGFNGKVKTIGAAPFTSDRLVHNFDNIVVHAKSNADAALAAVVARQVWANRVRLAKGLDPDGTSYTDAMASALAKSVGDKTVLVLPKKEFVETKTATPAPETPEAKLARENALRRDAGMPEKKAPKVKKPEAKKPVDQPGDLRASLGIKVSAEQWADMATLNDAEQTAKYGTTRANLIKEAALAKKPTTTDVKPATVADLQIAIRLPSGEVISDPAARLHSDLITSKGLTAEQIADQTTDFGFLVKGVYQTKEQALSPLKRDDILGSAGLGLALERGTIKPTTPLGIPAPVLTPKKSRRSKVIAVEKAATVEGGEVVKPATAVKMADPITLKNDVFFEEIPFVLEHMDKPGDVEGARIGYSATGANKGYISIRKFGSKESSYRFKADVLPAGSVVVEKGRAIVDRQAVVDFLSDPVRRRSVITVSANSKWFHPEDNAENLKTKRPEGRPATGAGAPLGETNVDPKVLEGAVADDVKTVELDAPTPSRPSGPAGGHPEEPRGPTLKALADIRKKNFDLFERMLKQTPENSTRNNEVWAAVEAELLTMDIFVPEGRTKEQMAKGLAMDLRRLKEEGSKDMEWLAARGGTVADVPITLEAAQGVVRSLVGDVPTNVRFISDPSAPLGYVYFTKGELPSIAINLLKHSTPEHLRDTILEELIHPLQSDPALRQSFEQIERLVTEAGLERQRSEGYRPDELMTEAANELVRTLYAQHAESNVFRRAVNQVVLALKRTFGMDLTDQQVALFLVNRALKNRPAVASGQRRLVTKNATITMPDEPSLAITAYHGTPHLIRREGRVEVDPSKVGSGQGAATYGWGVLYVAEHPAVAESIREQLSGRRDEIVIDGVRRPDLVNPADPWENPEAFAAWTVVVSNGRYGEGVEETIKNLTSLSHEPFRTPRERQGLRDAAEAARKWVGKKVTSEPSERGGNLYTASLNAEPGDFLDWDKPLSEQSEKVRNVLVKLIATNRGIADEMGLSSGDYHRISKEFARDGQIDFGEFDIVGGALYRALSNSETPLPGTPYLQPASPKNASHMLNLLGIKGIRYLDQGSRMFAEPQWDTDVNKWVVEWTKDNFESFDTREAAQAYADRKRTSNYVIFDASIIKITHENGKEVPLHEAMREAGSGNAALESPEKVEEFTGPLTDKPEFFKDIARVVNKGLVPPPVIEMFDALSAGAKGELSKVFPGRIGTYRDEAGEVVPGPTFREVMRDPELTPEQKNKYALVGLEEDALYQHDRQKVFDRATDTRKKLDEAVIKSITSTPPVNEAERLSESSFASILDKIKEEREKAVGGAIANERIREGIDNIEKFNELLRQPVALGRAMTGIANQVGNDALLRAKPGEEALELISAGTGFDGGVFATPREWISALATHLDQLTRPNGTKSILANRDVIEAALYGLRQVADARQALMEVQMTNDGTLQKFNADYLADLQSKVPKGFSSILKNYAKAQVESDALTAAFKRLNKRIDTLTEREANLDEAISFLAQHDVNPEVIAFRKAVVEHTRARDITWTKEGPLVTYINPMTSEPVLIEHTYEKGETIETIRKLMALADAGLQYAARAGSDPQRAAGWVDFANNMNDYLKVASPDYDLLQDPLINPLAFITKAQFGILAESTFSRIPGFLKHQANRTMQGWASAVKAKNAFQKDNEAKVLGNNTTAMRTHPDMSLGQWHKEINTLIIDSKQHFGQTPYKVGDMIIGFGHVITREDMKAADGQYRYEQVLRKLHERTPLRVLEDNPAMIKVDKSHSRLAMSQGPGTVTRYLPHESRNLPREWEKAAKADETRVEEGGTSEVDRFLNSGDNFIRVMLGHVMEEERDYFLLGKGPFWRDYRSMRSRKQALQADGEMPNSLDSLSEWVAAHHNEHLADDAPPVTPGDVRKALIDEVSQYMKEIAKNTAETKTAAESSVMSVVVYENGFTRPRGGKIAPGTLYDYGLPDRQAMVAKGNDAVEFYLMEYREALTALHRSLVDNKGKLLELMKKESLGDVGIVAKHKMDRGIRGGSNPQLERQQLTYGETTRNINRTARLLNNINRILESRQEFYGDDIATRIFAPWAGSLVGSVLMRPLTWIRNASSGSVLWGMMTGEIRKGGWAAVPHQVLYNHLASFTKTILKNFIPKDAKQAALKRMLDTPEIRNGIAQEASNLLQEEGRREQLRRAGVLDTFSVGEYLGLDAERTTLQNIKAAWDGLRNVNVRPGASLRSEVVSYLGVAPRAYQILTRKVGMRWADNSINVKSVQFANSLAESLRFRAIEAFDARLENDAVFKQLYEEYGDNFLRFSLALTGKGKAGLLTPAELTGKFIPLTTDKAAIQLRRLFDGNNDSVDTIMLKYWWNQRHKSGDKQAPFMTDGQGLSLMFAMAQNVNMGTLANRAQFFAGSKFRQLAGVLSQYWLWNTDKLVDLMSKPRGQRTLGVRYLPGTIGFLLVAALAGIVSTKVGQEANNLAFNTVSQKPDFWDATDDETRLKILLSNMGGYMGAIGSVLAKLTDQPGKLGYTNPIFFANVLTDTLNVFVKMWQSKDAANPTMDFLAKYYPIAQAVINRVPGREGLVDVRNAANALRAATPGSLEAKRRQPSAGSDFSLTPMTPLYNGIVNAAARGAWGEADELMAKAVEQQRAQGNANPEAAILSAIRTRSPESAVFQRVLTPEEKEMVYGRLAPDARSQVDRVNGVFDELASRYGRGTTGAGSFGSLGGTLGGDRRSEANFGRLTTLGAAAADTPTSSILGGGGGRPLSLGGSSGGVRRGFRTRSLMRRGLRSRSLLRSRRRRRLRLPRVRA